MSRSDPQYHLSPNQQDLLVAALASNQPSSLERPSANSAAMSASEKEMDNNDSIMQNRYQNSTDNYFNTSAQTTDTPGRFPLIDDSPYLGFDPNADGDDQLEFDSNGQLIDDFAGDASQGDSADLHEKRKSFGDKEDDEEGGGKRRESEGALGKKPGRKPLTAEPTSKRKAQNRAAQRAFRERKEKHLKDLETKVEDLEKASETTNQENGLLRAQVERLQVELKEYRKRLSWISNSGPGASSSLGSSAPGAAARNSLNSNQNDFRFDFPRFGDLPANQLLNNSDSNNKANNHPSRSSTLPSKPSNFGVPGVVERNLMSSSSPTLPPPSYGSTGNSPMNAASISPPARTNQNFASNSSFDGFSGLFSPSILEASRQASSGYFPQRNIATSATPTSLQTSENKIPNSNVRQQSTSSLSNTDSPNSSYESHQNGSSIGSSIGTSPEPSFNSPGPKGTDYVLLTISEENHPQNNFAASCITPGLDPNSFNWFAQQNGGGFDPVLFGDYRESQDAVASQDFGAFFNDAFPLPELGTPEHNFNEVAPSPAKPDLMTQVEAAQDGKEEAVPAQDTPKMMTCNKIWDRLQSMEKFRNGDIDIDNLCNDLRAKARCTEFGAAVNQKDADRILSSAR